MEVYGAKVVKTFNSLEEMQQNFEIAQVTVLGRNAAVVGNVVAAVPVRRGEVRREPQGVDTEVFEIIELFGQALKVADPIAVAIGKRARVDLIENSFLPPFMRHSASRKDGMILQ